MRNVLTICGKELLIYFRSPLAYGLLAFFALITGLMFLGTVQFFVQQTTQMQMMGRSMPVSVNQFVIAPVISNMAVVSMFLIPMITMRLFSEEKSRGTFELLATSPIRDLEIIIGKWLAGMVLYTAMLGMSLLLMAVLFLYGKPDWKPMMVGYLGLLLMGGALLAIGTFISSLTRSQVIAGAGAFAAALILWVIDWLNLSYGTSASGNLLEQAQYYLGQGIGYLSLITRFEPFARGVIELKSVVLFVTLIFFGLFLTSRSLESLRWKS